MKRSRIEELALEALRLSERLGPILTELIAVAQNRDLAEARRQLRGVERSIPSLETAGVPVPEELISRRHDLEKMLKRVDILFLNDSEAKDLTGERNLIAAIRAVRKFGPSTVVAKKGEHGAVLYMDGTFFTVPAYPLEVVPDPTGGGDSFAGGVLGYLAERGSFDLPTFRDAMLYGTAVASYVIEDFGPKRLYGLGREKIEERVEGLRKMMEL